MFSSSPKLLDKILLLFSVNPTNNEVLSHKVLLLADIELMGQPEAVHSLKNNMRFFCQPTQCATGFCAAECRHSLNIPPPPDGARLRPLSKVRLV
jgi:hypothetical protein